MTPNPAFERVVLVHTAKDPEHDLLEYAALLASTTPDGAAVAAVYPANGVLRALTPALRGLFEARGLRSPDVRVLTEPDVDGVLEAAREHCANLLVVRHPRFLEDSRSLARIILSEAPCSVCFVPLGVEPRIRRVIVTLAADGADADLVAHAVQVYNGAGATELVAVHSRFSEVNGYSRSLREHFRLEDSLRLSTSHDLQSVARSLTGSAPFPGGEITAPAGGFEPDLVLVGRRPGRSARVSAQLLRDCPFPLMQVLLPDRARGWRDSWKRAFSNSSL
jgi:hypothetical protein